MKDNIQTALLAVLTLTMVYGTFIKEDSPSKRAPYQVKNQRQNTPPANQPAQNNFAASTSPINSQPAQPAQPSAPATNVAFAQMEHNFGVIKQDTENEHVFEFTNTGDNPLIIENAKGSCGCTVPEYPKEPIMPGEKGEIKVVYKPGKQQGTQNKTVTITANTLPKDTRLTISANVEKI